ncbi:hypothetical protein HDV05_008773 [Chytridiales sp. JEL 0842]|nr:hypothetical protein HDV05_008773 [Chytridiales sp. JEL 0842]
MQADSIQTIKLLLLSITGAGKSTFVNTAQTVNAYVLAALAPIQNETAAPGPNQLVFAQVGDGNTSTTNECRLYNVNLELHNTTLNISRDGQQLQKSFEQCTFADVQYIFSNRDQVGITRSQTERVILQLIDTPGHNDNQNTSFPTTDIRHRVKIARAVEQHQPDAAIIFWKHGTQGMEIDTGLRDHFNMLQGSNIPIIVLHTAHFTAGIHQSQPRTFQVSQGRMNHVHEVTGVPNVVHIPFESQTSLNFYEPPHPILEAFQHHVFKKIVDAVRNSPNPIRPISINIPKPATVAQLDNALLVPYFANNAASLASKIATVNAEIANLNRDALQIEIANLRTEKDNLEQELTEKDTDDYHYMQRIEIKAAHTALHQTIDHPATFEFDVVRVDPEIGGLRHQNFIRADIRDRAFTFHQDGGGQLQQQYQVFTRCRYAYQSRIQEIHAAIRTVYQKLGSLEAKLDISTRSYDNLNDHLARLTRDYRACNIAKDKLQRPNLFLPIVSDSALDAYDTYLHDVELHNGVEVEPIAQHIMVAAAHFADLSVAA